MCLAIPVEVIAVRDGASATVNIGGVQKDISTALLHDLSVGDYVILHAGFALSRLDPDEAERTLALLEELETAAPGRAR